MANATTLSSRSILIGFNLDNNSVLINAFIVNCHAKRLTKTNNNIISQFTTHIPQIKMTHKCTKRMLLNSKVINRNVPFDLLGWLLKACLD